MSKREFTLFLAIISIICLIVISFVVFKRLNTNNKESNENNPEEFSIYESSEYQRIISEPHELNFDQEYDKGYAYLVNDSVFGNKDVHTPIFTTTWVAICIRIPITKIVSYNEHAFNAIFNI